MTRIDFRVQAVKWASCGFLVCLSSAAHADVSTWAYAGGGASRLSSTGDSNQGLLQVDAGLGISPEYPVVVGALFRMMTHFGEGTDWALLERTASHGFVNGDWGAALDLGGYKRWWEPSVAGFMVTLNGGLPWGVNVSATLGVGQKDDRSLGFSVGIDWARLTAYRETGTNWWPNYRLPLREEH